MLLLLWRQYNNVPTISTMANDRIRIRYIMCFVLCYLLSAYCFVCGKSVMTTTGKIHIGYSLKQMNKRLKIFSVFMEVMTVLSSCNAVNLDFYQDEYDVVLQIARCSWFNNTIYKYFKAESVLYNRTARIFNASWEQVTDLTNDMMLHIQVYKFTSNEFRFFPITVDVNVCAEYKRNTLRIRELLTKTSNFKPCNAKKGIYYVGHAIIDFSKLPPHMPRGQYKVVETFTYQSFSICILEFVALIKDKPVDWKNIPKRDWH